MCTIVGDTRGLNIMARNRRRKREVSTPTSSLTVSRLLSVNRPLTPTLSPLSDRIAFQRELLSDRRQFHPLLDYRPATFVTGGTPSTRLKDRSYGRRPPILGSSGTKAVQVFGKPDAVSVCVRRHRRREVLFAKGHGGSRRRKRSYRRNWFSAISC